MRTCLLCFLCLFLTTQSQAQWVVGGSLNASGSTYESVRTTTGPSSAFGERLLAGWQGIYGYQLVQILGPTDPTVSPTFPFTTTITTTTTAFTGSFSPYVAKPVGDRWLAGLQLGIGYNRSINENDQINKGLNFRAGPFARYEVMPGEKFAFFLQGSAMIFTQRNRYGNRESTSPSSRENGFSSVVAPGVSFRTGPRFRLLARFGQLYYATSKYEGLSGSFKSTRSDFGVSLHPSSLYLGGEFLIN